MRGGAGPAAASFLPAAEGRRDAAAAAGRKEGAALRRRPSAGRRPGHLQRPLPSFPLPFFLPSSLPPPAANMAGPAAAAPGADVKPFTPEKAKEIVMSLQQPAVFCNMVDNWPALHWNTKYLSALLDGKTIQFRIGMKTMDLVPQFETRCSYVEATLQEFLAWSCGQPSCLSGPFSCYEYSKYWAYADYKYIARLFEHKEEVFQDIKWSDFGFPGRSGKESTLWIGSEGANTPCHLDSYGCNLVLQVQGRKRWHLFPPGDTSFLYPTRIPYEESSVFSKVNVANPDLKRFPEFRNATAHMVTLSPGQVLLVPRHWWHYVESIDPVTVSINSWIELDADHEARVEEAITRTLVCAIKSAENPSDADLWLNPTEIEATSHDINLQYLNRAVSAYFKCQKASVSEQAHPSSFGAEKMTSASRKRRKRQVGTEPEGCKLLTHEADFSTVKAEKLQKISFGPHLIQVLPQSQETSSMDARAVESDYRDLIHGNEGGHFGKLHCARKQLVMSNDCEMPANQMDSDGSPNASQTTLSTNDLLDCLVNPHVISLVAQLLLERTRI